MRGRTAITSEGACIYTCDIVADQFSGVCGVFLGMLAMWGKEAA